MKPTFKHYFIIIALLLSTIAILHFFDLTTKVDDTPLNLSLPDTVGEYTGENIFFCQNIDCMKSIPEELLADHKCPFCGGEIDVMSLPEKRMLPEDTTILRKIYKASNGNPITVSIVISGAERTSIHRPQMCLPGQGYEIVRQYTHNIPTANHYPLKITILDIKSTINNSQHLFAYWFISKDHETPYHIKRLLLTAMDNIVRGISPRWGYVSVMTNSSDDPSPSLNQIESFIKTLHPLILTTQTQPNIAE